MCVHALWTVFVHTHARIHALMHAPVHTRTNTCTHVRTHTRMHARTLQEALVYVHNLKPPNLMNVFIREGIFHAMNSSLLARTTTGRLLHLTLLCDVMSLEQMSLGFVKTV